MVVEDGDGHPSCQWRPVRHLQGDVLIIVQDRDLNGQFSGGHLVSFLWNWASPIWALVS